MDCSFGDFKIASFNTNHSEAFFNLIDSNRSRLEDFFAGTVSKTKTLTDTIQYCKEIKRRVNNKKYFPFIITHSETNAFIGLVDIKNTDWDVPKAEIGYFIDSEFAGQGITSKALTLVIEYAIEKYNFKKLLCRASSKNLGSIGVALKNGFELEGTIRSDYRTTKGEIVDLNYYGRIFN